MFGIVMAFKDYDISMGISGIFTSKWVGMKYFKEFFASPNFAQLVRNTVGISIYKLIFTFPIPILFAITINEMRNIICKKVVQTASYLPHFISWVIIGGIATQFLSSRGVINTFLVNTGLTKDPIGFLTDPNLFWGFAVVSDIWKEMGWWAIIFSAAIVGISPDLYEAAEIDGASRLQRIWHITLPGIRETTVVVLILALGNLFGGGLSGSNFDQSFLLGNTMNQSASEIIQSYTFRVGLSQGRYAYATAVGIVQSIISLILIFSSNTISKHISGLGIF